MATRGSEPVSPTRRVTGRLRVPGDKSISHRYAMLAALANGTSVVHGFAPGGDCQSTLRCLEALGVEISRDVDLVTIIGRGAGRFRSPREPLDAGNSGTTTRLLAGILAAMPFSTTVAGDESLSRRPMRRVIDPLTRMGARIESRTGTLPMTITGGALQAIDHRTEVPSAQVKSAVLLAGLQASGTTRVTEAYRTRDHTELALRQFGVSVDVDDRSVAVTGGQPLSSAHARGSGRLLVRRLLGRGGGSAARLPGRHRGSGVERHQDRVARGPRPGWSGRSGRPRRGVGRRAVRECDRVARRTSAGRRASWGGARPHRRNCPSWPPWRRTAARSR